MIGRKPGVRIEIDRAEPERLEGFDFELGPTGVRCTRKDERQSWLEGQA